jgi:hypothetical protein
VIRRLIVAGVIVAAVAPTGAGAEREAAGKPRLSLARGAPLAIRGVNFAPAERVRVTVSAELRVAKTVTADGSGRFVARFRVSYDRCLGLSALAVGSRGSRARLRMPEFLCRPGSSP